jgi:hypothetical protein
MELDITHMIDDSDKMPTLSGSRAELGNNAGKITWRNSLAYGKAHPLLKTDADKDEARKYFKGFGAWSKEEIAAWSDDELQALVCQYIAGDIREMESADSYEEYQKGAEAGRYGGRLYKGDDGRFYFSLCD